MKHKRPSRRIKKIGQSNLGSIFTIVIFMAIGVYLLFSVGAATPVSSVEVEQGVTSCPNMKVQDNTASGGWMLRFGVNSCTSEPTIDTRIDTGVPIATWTNAAEIPGLNTDLYNGSPVGNFRVLCFPSHLSYDDPIVYRNQQGAAHLHMFFGNIGADYKSNFNSLKLTGDGTCSGGPLNRSAYWIPAMMDISGNVRVPSIINVYYKTNGADKTLVQKMPEGLRMMTSNSKATNAQSTEYIHWNCLSRSSDQLALIPTCQPGDGLQMFLRFEQCWDGQNLDTTTGAFSNNDHISHMAHPDNNHNCPPSHPVVLPEVTYNIVWGGVDTNTAGWYLTSDKMNGSLPGGTTTHADWFGAWQPTIMQTFIDNCVKIGRNCEWGRLGNGTKLLPIPNEYTGARTVTKPSSTTQRLDFSRPF